MGSLKPKLGDSLGKTLMQIAHDRLVDDLDFEKAIEVFTTSLEGFPEDIAPSLLTGEKVLLVNKETGFIELTDRDENHSKYPKLDIGKWCSKKHKWINKELRQYYESFQSVNSKRKDYSILGIDALSINDIITYKCTGDKDAIMDKVNRWADDDEFIQTYILLVDNARKFLITYCKYINLFAWAYRTYGKDIVSDNCLEISDLVDIVNSFVDNKPIAVTSDSELEEYLSSETSINSIIDKSIVPVDILDGYSAGWLAPNGDYYALNGTMANMLHLTIAERLNNIGLIPNDSDPNCTNSLDSRLEQAGWVKIHGNWILYGGYDLKRFGSMENKPLTDIQLEKIIKYGKVCHGGILKVGYSQAIIPAIRLEIIDKYMLEEYFSVDGKINNAVY